MKNLLNTGRLLLPVLVPSWRFFDEIAPSPRIEYCVFSEDDENAGAGENWREFRPRPSHVSVGRMLRRMIWNPRWNESLFLMSCAERLMSHPTRHSEDEIFDRILTDLSMLSTDTLENSHVTFRLMFIYRHDGALHHHVTYEAEPRPLYSAGRHHGL